MLAGYQITADIWQARLLAAFREAWAERSPVAWPNVDYDPDTPSARALGFVRPNIQHTFGEQAELGARLQRRGGVIIIQTYVREGSGRALSDSLARAALRFLRAPGRVLPGHYWLADARLEEAGAVGGWWQVNAAASFGYDTVQGGRVPA